jgi:homogentisate phytyltransferase/homogentisate geranylgeranyltransferase
VLAARVDPTDRQDFTRFYMRVWGLFFCEYLVVPAAVLLG